jgi:hypothetical protein
MTISVIGFGPFYRERFDRKTFDRKPLYRNGHLTENHLTEMFFYSNIFDVFFKIETHHQILGYSNWFGCNKFRRQVPWERSFSFIWRLAASKKLLQPNQFE